MKQNRKRQKAAAKADDPAQSRAFVEKAREIGADEEKSAADELLENLAKRKPGSHKEGR